MKKFLLIIILAPFLSQAATLRLNSSLGVEVGVGQIVPVDILLDADGENLNALELEVIYNKNFLEPVGFKDGGSIVQFWVERPDLAKGLLILKGIMPNGFNWQKGLIGTLDFKTLTLGITEIRFGANPKTFLNDGLGTEAKTKVSSFKILISSQNPTLDLEEDDQYPPEKFNLEVVQNPNLYDGRYILVFATQDKQSGIDHYEIQETKNKKPKADKWERAESPYLLKDQTRESYIFVKAVDRAGNERIEKLYSASYKSWYERPISYIIIILLLVLAVMAIWYT